jgi:hypothetical protein
MAERPGIPRNLYSGTASYSFDNGIALTASASHVPEGVGRLSAYVAAAVLHVG